MQIKIIFLNLDNNSIENRTHFIQQAFNKLSPSMERNCTKNIRKVKNVLPYKDIYR